MKMKLALPANFETLDKASQDVARAAAINARKAEIRLEHQAQVIARKERRSKAIANDILSAKKKIDRLNARIIKGSELLAKAAVKASATSVAVSA